MANNKLKDAAVISNNVVKVNPVSNVSRGSDQCLQMKVSKKKAKKKAK